MAEVKTKQATTTEAKPKVEEVVSKRVEVRLPRLQGQNANQGEFFSVNGKNYIIRRGETVSIPEELAEVIRNNEKAEEYAMRYVDEHPLRDSK